MKFQRSTLLLLTIALLLSGLVFVTEFLGKPQRDAIQTEQQQLFTFKEADVQSVRILTEGRAVEIALAAPATSAPKSGKPSETTETTESTETTQPQATEPSPAASPAATPSPPAPKWQMLQPVNQPANDATVAYLLSLLTTSQRDRTLTVPTTQLAEIGLAPPLFKLEVTLKTGKIQQLLVGNPDFSNQFLYALANPSAQGVSQVEVMLIPIALQNAIDRPLADWQQPPATSTTPSNPPTSKPTRQSDDQPDASIPTPNTSPVSPTAPSSPVPPSDPAAP